jgi:hypothetical protein
MRSSSAGRSPGAPAPSGRRRVGVLGAVAAAMAAVALLAGPTAGRSARSARAATVTTRPPGRPQQRRAGSASAAGTGSTFLLASAVRMASVTREVRVASVTPGKPEAIATRSRATSASPVSSRPGRACIPEPAHRSRSDSRPNHRGCATGVGSLPVVVFAGFGPVGDPRRRGGSRGRPSGPPGRSSGSRPGWSGWRTR